MHNQIIAHDLSSGARISTMLLEECTAVAAAIKILQGITSTKLSNNDAASS
jgi:hypothetical protein